MYKKVILKPKEKQRKLPRAPENPYADHAHPYEEIDDNELEPVIHEPLPSKEDNQKLQRNIQQPIPESCYLEPVKSNRNLGNEQEKENDKRKSEDLHPYQPVLKQPCEVHKYSTPDVDVDVNDMPKNSGKECNHPYQPVQKEDSNKHKYTTINNKDIKPLSTNSKGETDKRDLENKTVGDDDDDDDSVVEIAIKDID